MNKSGLKPSHRLKAVFSPVLRRIMAVNVLALAMLGGGILYLNDFQEDLIEQQLNDLMIQAEIIAAAIGESPALGPESTNIPISIARQTISRLIGPTDKRARFYSTDGTLVVDSRFLDNASTVDIAPLPEPGAKPDIATRAFDYLNDFLDALTFDETLPVYRERPNQMGSDYPEVVQALAGNRMTLIRRLPNQNALHLAAAVPIQRFRRVLGALLITADTAAIQSLIESERIRFVKVFSVAFSITMLLSIFLANTIARPIRRLARAADEVRRSIGRSHALEQFSSRRDEIGDLSRSLAEMTETLYRQLDAVEAFAADVAHELKNPLTSIRSATETLKNAKSKKVQQELLQILEQDAKRLDRLISDISNASRLDAELSKSELETVNLKLLILSLADAYGATRQTKKIKIKTELPDKSLNVMGLEERIGQVLRNIIDNAISFSPMGSTVTIRAQKQRGKIILQVDDCGPGLSAEGADKIFKRFYSERPSDEAFGQHSGLGLSISKQIMTAHNGDIIAENIVDTDSGTIKGARFTIIFTQLS